MQEQERAFHVLTILLTPDGVPLIRKKGEEYYRIPGGKGEGVEPKDVAARRELHEETGIETQVEFLLLDSQEREGYDSYVVGRKVKKTPPWKAYGEKGEEVLFVLLENLHKVKVFPPHLPILRKHIPMLAGFNNAKFTEKFEKAA